MRAIAILDDDRRFGRLVVVALLVVLAAGMSLNTVADPDMWHEMALWRQARRLGTIPRVDSFAYTPTLPVVVHHEWLTGAILHTLATTGGAGAILVVRWLASALLVTMALLGARRNGATLAAAGTFALPLIAVSWIGFTTIRAGLFTLVLLAALLGLLDLDRAGRRRWLLAWPLLYVLWINLHAGFVLGVIVLALHAIEQALHGRRVGHLLALLAITAPLSLLTPWGAAYFGYLARAIPMAREHIGEWAPTWEAWPPIVVLYALLVAAFLYAVLRRGPRHVTGALIVAATAYAALRHQRHLPVFALTWLWYVPGALAPTTMGVKLDAFWQRRRSWIAILCALVGLPCVLLFVEGRPWRLTVPANLGEGHRFLYPVGAVEYLREQDLGGNLLVPFASGAYVTWKLHPKVRVSFDGRYEVAYVDGLLEEHTAFYQAMRGWEAMLDRYPHDAVLVPRWTPVAPLMADRPGWPVVYEDDAFLLCTRGERGWPRVDRRGERLAGRFP